MFSFELRFTTTGATEDEARSRAHALIDIIDKVESEGEIEFGFQTSLHQTTPAGTILRAKGEIS